MTLAYQFLQKKYIRMIGILDYLGNFLIIGTLYIDVVFVFVLYIVIISSSRLLPQCDPLAWSLATIYILHKKRRSLLKDSPLFNRIK